MTRSDILWRRASVVAEAISETLHSSARDPCPHTGRMRLAKLASAQLAHLACLGYTREQAPRPLQLTHSDMKVPSATIRVDSWYPPGQRSALQFLAILNLSQGELKVLTSVHRHPRHRVPQSTRLHSPPCRRRMKKKLTISSSTNRRRSAVQFDHSPKRRRRHS